MRIMIDFRLPLEPFNTMVRNGTAGRTIEKVLADIKPEAVYFSERDGKRGGIAIVNLDDPSQVPSLAEPFFLAFNATVEFHPVMLPEDLARAGLESLGKRYG